MRKSMVVFKCATPDCTKSGAVEFVIQSEVLGQSSNWKLPPGFREVETQIDGKIEFVICCQYHTVESRPVFVEVPMVTEG